MGNHEYYCGRDRTRTYEPHGCEPKNGFKLFSPHGYLKLSNREVFWFVIREVNAHTRI